LESVFHEDAENLKGKTDYDIFPQEMAEVFQERPKVPRSQNCLSSSGRPRPHLRPRGKIEAQKAGKVRYVGFTGHKDPLVHLRMLEVAAENKFRFDTCRCRLTSWMLISSFKRQVPPVLVKDEIGVLA